MSTIDNNGNSKVVIVFDYGERALGIPPLQTGGTLKTIGAPHNAKITLVPENSNPNKHTESSYVLSTSGISINSPAGTYTASFSDQYGSIAPDMQFVIVSADNQNGTPTATLTYQSNQFFPTVSTRELFLTSELTSGEYGLKLDEIPVIGLDTDRRPVATFQVQQNYTSVAEKSGMLTLTDHGPEPKSRVEGGPPPGGNEIGGSDSIIVEPPSR